MLSEWNTDFIYYDLTTLNVNSRGVGGTYNVSFDYRCGDPFMTCEKTTCIASGSSLSKLWTIDTPTVWQDIGVIDDIPFDTGTGNETLAGSCDTCGDIETIPFGDSCPYEILPNGECGYCASCRPVCCPAGATVHLVGIWEEQLDGSFVFVET